jgi:hypothetical protein
MPKRGRGMKKKHRSTVSFNASVFAFEETGCALFSAPGQRHGFAIACGIAVSAGGTSVIYILHDMIFVWEPGDTA